jgi:ribulose-5-phosphate 4-epimerase/fuculose-1-phosphate aldolase
MQLSLVFALVTHLDASRELGEPLPHRDQIQRAMMLDQENTYKVNQIAHDDSVMFDPRVADTYLRHARMIANRGYVSATTGNMAIRQKHPSYPDGICYVKCQGVSLEEMTVEDLVITDVQYGRILYGERGATVGHQMHREILRLRSDVQAVIHLHHDETVAFFAAGFEELKIAGLTFPYLMQSLPHYLLAHVNVEEDVAPIKTFIAEVNCFIMKRHGFTVLGRNVSECYHRVNVLTSEVKRNIIAEQLAAARGTKPTYLNLDEMRHMFQHGDAVMYPAATRDR